jgi:hypothetical protein
MGAYGQGGRAPSPGPMGLGQPRHRSYSPGPRVAYGQPQSPMGAYGQPQSAGGMYTGPQQPQQQLPGSPGSYQQQQYFQQQMGRGRGAYRG